MSKMSILLVSLFMLSGCSFLPPMKTPTTTTYVLNTTPCPHVRPTRNITILVSPPTASAIYNTTQMAYSRDCYEIAYFAKSSWADTPPNMLQPLIVQTLQNTHHFHAVESGVAAANADYTLNTELLELQQDFNHFPSIVRLRARVLLINNANNAIVATKQFCIYEQAGNTPCDGVYAANKAVACLLHGIEQFCLRHL